MIADADSIYDVRTLDDQLVLGIKSSRSIAERKVLHQRMQQGTESKACQEDNILQWSLVFMH